MEKDETENTKKGGPYPKKEQEERRRKVYNLHFEKGYSAIKIAEILQINRNTINEDIHFLYDEISKQIPNNTWSFILKPFERLDGQYARLNYELENQMDFQKRMLIERMLLTVNDKHAQLSTKCINRRWNVFHGMRVES